MGTKKNINILFLGGAKRVSLAERFIKAGENLGVGVNIFSYELNYDVPIAFIGKVILGLYWNDEDIINHLKRNIYKYNIDIVLPFVDTATLVASKLKEEIFNEKVFIPVSSPETCGIFFDKIEAHHWFLKHNFPVPPTETKYPMIAKPRKGSASKGVKILNNDYEMEGFRKSFNSSLYLIQQYIRAEEYTVDCYVSTISKLPLCIVPRKRIEVNAGEVTKAITVKHEIIEDISYRILRCTEYIEGPVTIQYLEEKETEKVYVMEANPRFGGGVLASIEAGANIPEMILKEFLELPFEPIKNWRPNTMMLRAYREFFLHETNN